MFQKLLCVLINVLLYPYLQLFIKIIVFFDERLLFAKRQWFLQLPHLYVPMLSKLSITFTSSYRIFFIFLYFLPKNETSSPSLNQHHNSLFTTGGKLGRTMAYSNGFLVPTAQMATHYQDKTNNASN